MTKNFKVTEHTVPASHIRQYFRSTANGTEQKLHLAVKQYTPHYDVQHGDATILACHASGFPKELYEPMWETLFDRAQNQGPGSRIRAIWIADVVNMGQSGVMNAEQLGNEPSYYDHARDYLNMINHLHEHMVQPLVGFGHSMGGNVIINLALMHPRLMHTIVTVEPIVGSPTAYGDFGGSLALSMKRDRWPDRDAAMASIVKSPFYAKWDKRVLNIFRECGLRDLPTPLYPRENQGVTLTTTKHQEALSFARECFPPSRDTPLEDFVPDRVAHPDIRSFRNPRGPFYRPENTLTFEQLPFLRPSCYFIYGSKTHFLLAQGRARQDKLEVTGTATGGSGGAKQGRVEEAVVNGSHFSPFEQPVEVAELVGKWLDSQMQKWRTIDAEQRRAWDAVPQEKKGLVSDDFLYWAQKTWGQKRPPAQSSKQGAKAGAKL